MAGLPTTRIVSSQVSFSALLAQEVPINTMLIVTNDDVIDAVERIRTYSSLSEVATDFSSTAPAYLGAQAWFAQSPRPSEVKIGRWVRTASKGKLVGGAIDPADLLPSAWTPFTTGAVLVTVDGVPRGLSDIDLSAVTNLNGVASAIQTALVNDGAVGATVVWNSAHLRFEVTSGSTGTSSSVGFLQPPAASGYINWTGNIGASNSVVLRGVQVQFVAASPVGNQVLVGATLADSINNLKAFLQASTDPLLSSMTYSTRNASSPTRLYVTAKVPGTAGNAYTIVTAGNSAMTTSGPTLTGGGDLSNDLSAMLAGTSTTPDAYVVPGMAAEAALSAADALHNRAPGSWYGFYFHSPSDSDNLALAAWAEASSPPHYYGLTSQNAAAKSSTSTSDLVSVLASMKLNRTATQYSSTSMYAIISYLARILTTRWDGRNTTITLMFKDEPGIVPETLTTDQANALQSKNCNVLARYNNPGGSDLSFLQYGVSCSGNYTDTVVGADWLSGHVQTAIFNVLRGSLKVPQTDSGMMRPLNAAEAACVDAVNNGYLGRGLTWNSQGFGALETGQVIDKGFYVFAPSIVTQAQGVRETRRAPLIQIAAKTAGAIHGADVLIFIQQ